MEQPSIGDLIFISIRPLVKIALPTLGGFIITRSGLFPVSASKAVASVLLTLFMPALLFSKVVTSIDEQNVSSLGIIVLVCIFYQAVGAVLGAGVLAAFPTPRTFRYGLIVACTWSNFGDLPTAVVQSVAAAPPFSAGDSDLAVAYVSVFIVVWFITLFPLQGSQLIKFDYTRDSARDEEKIKAVARKAVSPIDRIFRRKPHRSSSSDIDLPSLAHAPSPSRISSEDKSLPSEPMPMVRRVTLREAEAIAAGPSIEHATTRASARSTAAADDASEKEEEGSRSRRFARAAWTRFLDFASPPSVALLVALVIALINPLKALFVRTGYPMPDAPDGSPPLAVLLETASFVGNASVPTGLLVLGASLARMSIPRPIRKLPIRSIFAVAVMKMCLMPVLGVLLVEGLVKGGLVNSNDRVLRFTLVYFSCVPSATFQVALSQVYCPDGVECNASTLCVYLIVQYAFLLLTGTITTAYTLSKLF